MSHPVATPAEDPWGPDAACDGYEEWDEVELDPAMHARRELGRMADALVEAKRAESRAAAARYSLIDEFRLEWESSEVSGAPLPGMRSRAMRAELAAALGLSERTVESLVGRARALVHDLPATFAALRCGAVSDRHAQIVVDETAGLTRDEIVAFESEALLHAVELTPAKFARKARSIREHIRRRDLADRHAAAAEDRSVSLIPQRDGMADLLLHLPAVRAVAIHSRADRIARTLDDPADVRTLSQKRADVLTDLLLDEQALAPSEEGTPRQSTLHRGFRAEVHVTVPVPALIGDDELPASLDGYGPIAPEVARELAGTATGFHRVLTHPETGVTLSFGRDRYEVPAELKRYIRARDETCRFVGCTRAAVASDIDHTEAWNEGGETAAWNLGCLCRSHHRLKHNSAWALKHAADSPGDYLVTSPLGRSYRTRPAIQVGAGVVAQKKWLDDPPPF